MYFKSASNVWKTKELRNNYNRTCITNQSSKKNLDKTFLKAIREAKYSCRTLHVYQVMSGLNRLTSMSTIHETLLSRKVNFAVSGGIVL